MQFIDQSAAYNRKSISLADAIKTGRANLFAVPGADQLAKCFRPELSVATAFDKSIDPRVKFADLSTAAKLDLMIDELLPGFFHPDLLPDTGRDRWSVRFTVDGDVQRDLHINRDGIRAGDPAPEPDIEVETDIVTLMAMLRSVIAAYHTSNPKVRNARVAGLNAD